MNKLLPLLVFSILLLVPVGAENAFGAISTFTDKTTFLTTTGATSATGALPNLGDLPGGAAGTATVGTVTFTITPPSSRLFIGNGAAPDWTSLTSGNDIAISDIENLNADLVAPVFSLGFDFVEHSTTSTTDGCNGTCIDSTFSVTLKNGPTTVASFQFNAPDDVLAFVGVLSDTAFDRVEIRDITATIDNEYFGEFYSNTNPPPEPPEPPSLVVGGELIPIETTSLILASAQSFSWMIPVVLSGIGIGLFVVSRKND